jgi:hypothetical protein
LIAKPLEKIMPIDPNIALSIKPIQLANPLEQYMQVQQIQQAQNQSRLADLMYGEKQREISDAAQMNDQYKNAIGADGTIDRAKLIGGIAGAGLGSRIPGIQKQLLEADDKTADIGYKNAQSKDLSATTAGKEYDLREKKRQKAIVDIAGFKTPQEALASLDAHQQAGDLTPEAAAGVRATIPTNPADFPKWQIGMLQRIMSAGDGMKYLTPDANTVSTNTTSRANNTATNATTRRGQDMTDARAKEQNALTREGQQTQVVVDPNQGPLLINKATKTAVPATFADGTRVPGENAVAASKLNDQLQAGIAEARRLIPLATSSGAGALADKGAAFFGKSTQGADAAAQLDTLAGWMTANVPRMQGPQSDKDVLLYRQMAGDVSNRGLPASRRLAALDTLEKLQNKYADINQSGISAKAPTNVAPATNAKGWTLHVDASGNKAYVSPDGKSFEEVK